MGTKREPYFRTNSPMSHAHLEVPARTAQPWMALGLAQACACFPGRVAKGYRHIASAIANAVIVSLRLSAKRFKRPVQARWVGRASTHDVGGCFGVTCSFCVPTS